jgi:hypothetical protein
MLSEAYPRRMRGQKFRRPRGSQREVGKLFKRERSERRRQTQKQRVRYHAGAPLHLSDSPNAGGLYDRRGRALRVRSALSPEIRRLLSAPSLSRLYTCDASSQNVSKGHFLHEEANNESIPPAGAACDIEPRQKIRKPTWHLHASCASIQIQIP